MSTASPDPSASAASLSGNFGPVRYVHQRQTCHLCWGTIAAGAPGSSAGTRGTRAFFLPRATLTCAISGRLLLGPGLWECLECHAS